MLNRQSVYSMSKYDPMSKIPAGIFLHCSVRPGPRFNPKPGISAPFLTVLRPHRTIHLESAVFMFHIKQTTQGITGSLRAACSEPVQRFLACPFKLTKTDAPNTRVSLTPLARSWLTSP